MPKVVNILTSRTKFTLTEDHINLLKRACIEWNDSMYYGSAGIDIKRPYGNKDVIRDVCVACGWIPYDFSYNQDDIPKKLQAKAMMLHRDMEIVLQIVLKAQTFELGKYELEGSMNYDRWTKVRPKTRKAKDDSSRVRQTNGHGRKAGK